MSSNTIQHPRSSQTTQQSTTANTNKGRKATKNDPLIVQRSSIGAVIFRCVITVLLLVICALQLFGLKSTRDWQANNEAVQKHVAVIQADIADLRTLINTKQTEEILSLKIQVLNSRVPSQSAREIAAAVYKYAMRYERDPDLVLSIMKIESGFDPKAVSSMGAIGLMQVMPQWIDVLDIQCDLHNPDCSTKYGLQILAAYEQLYGDLDMALTAYNRGPGPVDYALMRGKDPDNGYAGKVRAVYDRLRALNGSPTNLEVAYTK